MRRFEWNPSLESGEKDIDDQHRKLFTMGSEFNETITAGGHPSIAIKLIESLANYAVHHFTTEQEWMSKANYPDLSAHTVLHEDLKRKLVEKIMAIKNGRAPMTAEISIFIHDWITHHILEQDLRAIKWCKEQLPKSAEP